jgi:protein CpxP
MMMLRGLDLTEAQREQIRAIAEENRPDEAQRQKVGELHKSLQAAVFADSADLAQIEQLKAALGEAEAAALSKRVDVQLKIAQVLTAEQRAKAREMPARGPGRGRAGR